MVEKTLVLVVRRGMMFGEIITMVGGARSPMNKKLFLRDTVAQPVEAHVDCFGAFLFDGSGYNAESTFVVGLDGSRRLGSDGQDRQE
jgi:hypothetical protein